MSNVVNPWTRSAFRRYDSHPEVIVSEYHLILLFQVAIGSSPIFFHAEHRVGEDVGFGVGELISVFTQEVCRHVRGIIEIDNPYTNDLFFVHWSVFQFRGIAIPHCSKNYPSRIVTSPESLVQDELLLEEWHSEICPKMAMYTSKSSIRSSSSRW